MLCVNLRTSRLIAILHSDKPLWGSDATSFNPRRFMAQSEKSDSAAKRPDPAAPFRDASGKVYSSAYRSFGGGNNICKHITPFH